MARYIKNHVDYDQTAAAAERDAMRHYLATHPERGRLVAYHEAGHVVQYLRMCRKYHAHPEIEFLTIVPDEVNNGSVRIRPLVRTMDVQVWPHLPPDALPDAHDRAKEQIKYLLAGFAMEFEHDPEEAEADPWDYFCDAYFLSDGAPGEDWTEVAWWLEQITGDAFAEGHEAFQLGFALFEEVLRDLRHDPAVQELTDLLVLHKTMDATMLEPFVWKE